jgi:AcrR family transcriptional regulator
MTPARRAHDAEASRGALLRAAHELFEARGYDASTVREIGELADVDPALIARYFGGKEGLYLATLEEKEAPPPSLDPAEAIRRILGKTQEAGDNPVPRAIMSATVTPAMRDQIREILRHRLTAPMAAELASQGTPDAELLAELLIAMAVGVHLARGGGALPRLAEAPVDDVLAALEPLLEAVGA